MKLNHYLMEDALESLIDYRGKTPKKSDEGIPTLSAKSVKNGYIDYGECYYISKTYIRTRSFSSNCSSFYYNCYQYFLQGILQIKLWNLFF